MPSLKQKLSYLLLGQQGWENRIKIIDLLNERPYNINQMAKKLDLNYRTIKHHIDILMDHKLVSASEMGTYGEVYFLSPQLENNINLYENLKNELISSDITSKLLENIIESSIAAFVVTDLEGNLEYVNPRFTEIFGYEEDEVLGKSLNKFVDNEFEAENVLDKFGKESTLRREITLIAKDGEKHEILCNASLIKDHENIHVGIAHTLIDITDRKRLEDELKVEKELFQSVFNRLPLMVTIYDPKMNDFRMNDKFVEVIGWTEENAQEEGLMELCYPDKEYRKKVSEFMSKTEPVWKTFDLHTKDGGIVKSSWTNIRISDDRQIGIGIDIREKKKLEKDLRESEEKYKGLFDAAPDPAFLIDKEGSFKELNRASVEKTGYDKEKMTGRSLKEPLPFLSDEDREKLLENFEKRLDGQDLSPYTLEIITKDNQKLYVEINTRPLQIDDELLGVVGIARDITKRKEAEGREEFLHSLLIHDLGNKSQIINSYLDMMDDYEISDDVKEFLNKVKQASKESVDLIRKVKRLRDIDQKEEIKDIDLKSAIDEVISEHKIQLDQNDIDIETQQLDYKVRGGSLLTELFSNLIENSIKHSGCNKISIRARDEGDECIVTVEDDGVGISDELKDKIFVKRYRREGSEGSGLGLYLVKEIAENYEGNIKLKGSELGGARFDITLKKT